MKSELFPDFSNIQKYIINGDIFPEVEFNSNYEALIKFLSTIKNKDYSNELVLRQSIKDLILNKEKFEEYLQYSGLTVIESIIFIQAINPKKIFTTNIVKELRKRYGKTIKRAKNSSRIRLERSSKNKRNIRKKRKSSKL